MNKLLKVFLRVAYTLVVVGLSGGAIYFLDTEDLPIITASIAAKTLTFAIAAVSVILVEIVYAWRMHIDPVAAFNKIEENPMAAGVFLGLLSLGFSILGAAIYG